MFSDLALVVEFKEIIRRVDVVRFTYILNNIHKLSSKELDEIHSFVLYTLQGTHSVYPVQNLYGMLLDSNVPRLQLIILNHLMVKYRLHKTSINTSDEYKNHHIKLTLLNEVDCHFNLEFMLIDSPYCPNIHQFYYNLFFASTNKLDILPFFVITEIMKDVDRLKDNLNNGLIINLHILVTKWITEYIVRDIEARKKDNIVMPNESEINASIRFFEMIRINAEYNDWLADYAKMMKGLKKFYLDNKLIEKKNVFPIIKK